MEPNTPTNNRSRLIWSSLGIIALILAGIFYWPSKETTPSDDIASTTAKTTMKATDVDPILKKEVIAGYTTQKALIQTKDIAKIRAYVNDAAPAESREMLSKATDGEFTIFLNNYLKILNLTTEEMLAAPDSVWTFDPDMSAVAIKSKVPGEATLTTTVLVIKRDGVWR